MPGFGGFGGLGAAPGGWLSGMEQGADIEQRRLQAQRLQQQMQITSEDQAAIGIAGNALRALSAPSGQGPPLPAPPPGQQSVLGGGPVPGGPPVATGPGQIPPGFSGGLPGKGGVPGGFSPQPMASQPPPMGGGPPGMPPGAMSPAPTSGQGQPSSPPPSPGPAAPSGGTGPSQTGGGGGPLSLKQLINAVTGSNPRASPSQIMRAVDQLAPLLKYDEQQQWHQQSLELRRLQQVEKAREFDSRENRLRDQFDGKIAQKEQELAFKVAAKADDNEIKRTKVELDRLKSDRTYEIGRMREERQLTLGQENVDVKRERIGAEDRRTESQERIAEGRQQTTRDVATQRIEGQRDVQQMRGDQSLAQIGARGAEARTTEGAKQQGRLELQGLKGDQAIDRLNVSNELKERLHKADNDTRIDIAAMHDANKFDLAMASNAFKKWYADQNIAAKKELQEFIETRKDERQAVTEAGKGARQDKALDIAQQRVNVIKAVSDQRIKLQEQRLGIQADKTYGVNADKQRDILSNAGVSPDQIKSGADYYNMNNKLPPDTAGLTGLAKSAYTKAVTNLADQQVRDMNLSQSPGQYRLANAALVRAGQKTVDRFLGSGPQGDSTRFLSVAAAHLDTAERLNAEWQALGGGSTWLNIPALQGIKSYVMTQLGYPEPENVQIAAQILGTEIIKSLAVARAGTAQERKEIADRFATVRSPEQFQGILGTARELLGGQMGGLKTQFVGSAGAALLTEQQAGKLFDGLLTQQAKDMQIKQNKGSAKWRAPWLSFDPDDFRSQGNKDREELQRKLLPEKHGSLQNGSTMSDAGPDPVRAGQQYATDYTASQKRFNPTTLEGPGRAGAGGGGSTRSGEILSPRSLSTQTTPELKTQLKELDGQQRSLMQLRPMVPTLIKLGVTPQQMTKMTPTEAYQFVKARSPQGMGKVDRESDKIVADAIDRIRQQRSSVQRAITERSSFGGPQE